jgi:hypothetical protein
MHMLSKMVACCALLMLPGSAWALDPPRPASAPPATTAPASPPAPAGEPAATPEQAAGGGKAEGGNEDETLPPPPPGIGPTPQRFNPSEKVRADFPVSFPVDI